VTLDTEWRLDEHGDCAIDLPDVHRVADAMTPQNNLGVQTEVIRRAELFVGTCGSLAWLAPMLGTRTIAVYGNDRFLSPHLYAARQIYPLIEASPFLSVDLAAVRSLALEPEGALSGDSQKT
jgi:ADP-heptose:LPS heptosyltransferase